MKRLHDLQRDGMRENASFVLQVAVPSDDLEEIEAHAILIERPVFVTPKGTPPCRSAEAVPALLDATLPADFTEEDGERVGAPRT